MAREFEFDPKSQRYRVTKGAGKGSFISYEAVQSLTESYIEQSKVELDDITDQLLSGEISVGEWEQEMILELRDAHTNSYALGHGGIGRLGDRQIDRIADMVEAEAVYLRGFSEDILAGNLSEAQIRDRASMYVEGIYKSFELGREDAHNDAGFDEEKRVRNATESCDDCIEYEALGWQPIGTLPSIGAQCACRSRCRCHKEFRRSSDVSTEENSYSILENGYGWIRHTRKAKANSMEIEIDGLKYNAGTPTDEQLAKINVHSPLEPLTAEQVVTVPFLASNNLLWHSNGAWTVPSLHAMGELLIGRKHMLNHEWYDSTQGVGKIYDYSLIYSDEAPDSAINVAGMGKENQYIVERGGYARLILHCYFEAESDIVSDLKYGRMDDVSTGVMTSGADSFICPVCSERFGRTIRFNEKDEEGRGICPHSIPTPFMLWWYGEDNEEMNFARFYYRELTLETGHGIELSSVGVPDLPLAGTLSPYRISMMS